MGGESPVRFLHEAANRIARGESQVGAVVGGEATHAVAAAQKAGITLPWTTPDPNWSRTRGRDYLHPLAVRLGVAGSGDGLSLLRECDRGALGPDPGRGPGGIRGAVVGLLRGRRAQPGGLAGPGDQRRGDRHAGRRRNRPIAFPYNKLMVANPMVNQGAAILLTSLARAREAGIAEERLVYLWAGAAAVEPRDYLNRDHYHGAHAQNAVLDACAAIAAAEAARFDICELYSCFPCVPKMAARRLGLPPGAVPTTTGGLTFFGAPLNNYMTHAAAAMLRALRAAPGSAALLYGQGEFVTKHHAVVLASRPPREHRLPQDYSVQAEADGRRGPVPEFAEAASRRGRHRDAYRPARPRRPARTMAW